MQPPNKEKVGIFQAMGEMLGIVLLRFPFPLNVFSALLMTVNTLSLVFIDTIYGQIAFVAMSAGVPVIIVIYIRSGFVRLLGLAHMLWPPMLIWFAMNMPDKTDRPALYWWVISLFVFNSISLVIDFTDIFRYLALRQKDPHYYWKPPAI